VDLWSGEFLSEMLAKAFRAVTRVVNNFSRISPSGGLSSSVTIFGFSEDPEALSSECSLSLSQWERTSERNLDYANNGFIIMNVIAILLARAYPPMGADYLQLRITLT
jgi:hypothetical protein